MTEEEIAQFDKGMKIVMSKDKYIGAIYRNPGSDRLYECVYIYWDMKHQCLGSFRRPADGSQMTRRDCVPYRFDGDTGVETLILDYETIRIASGDIKVEWPANAPNAITTAR